jgi:hypothetical protein
VATPLAQRLTAQLLAGPRRGEDRWYSVAVHAEAVKKARRDADP